MNPPGTESRGSTGAEAGTVAELGSTSGAGAPGAASAPCATPCEDVGEAGPTPADPWPVAEARSPGATGNGCEAGPTPATSWSGAKAGAGPGTPGAGEVACVIVPS
ncbi:hypothetical protein [Streptomyces sp. NPDC005865]|uniref:hypothetical protein n=1 Tax=Streptomyces sp. NPDC005865 TaxID=3155453 RepID=UPI003408CB16